MAKVSFNVDAYTARLIGRENVAKLNGAILELVKNTYDADAGVCFIYYDDMNKCLYIGDNGMGMTTDIVMKHWMTIGNSSKRRRYISKSGRVQTGAKGIGRFALDRIGDQCAMLTRSESETLQWNVDWRAFDGEGTITDVKAELSSVTISFLDFLKSVSNAHVLNLVSGKLTDHGTIFKLTELRDIWNEQQISNLKNELRLLIPYEINQAFNIYIFENDTIIEDATVLHDNDSFSYDYKIEFNVAEDGAVKGKIYRNEFDFGDRFRYVMDNAGFSKDDEGCFLGTPIELSTSLSELMTKDNNKLDNPVGAFNGTFYFAKLSVHSSEKEKFYYKNVTGRRDFRETFGGIRIYRDNFRVRPYGEPQTSNFDWLQLSNRKTKSPAAITHPTGKWRANADQMLGSVYISRANIALPDQANREGIVETSEFVLLKKCLIEILELFERDRQYVCRKLDALYEKESTTEQYRHEIKTKAEKSKDKRQISFGAYNEARTNVPFTMVEAVKAQQVIDKKDELIHTLEDENRLLRALATTGITTNTYIHEFRELTHRLNMKIVMAKEAIEFDRDMTEAHRQIIIADQIRNSFTSWFRVTIDSVKKDKRSLKKINLSVFFKEAADAWLQVIESKSIKIRLTVSDEDIFFRCFPYEMETILTNLITNSVTMLNSADIAGKMIQIDLNQQPEKIRIDYSDNGLGLSSVYKQDPRLILEPFETDKVNVSGEKIGTGMGMWIINKTVSEYNGNVDLSRNKTEPEGFYISIEMPRNC